MDGGVCRGEHCRVAETAESEELDVVAEIMEVEELDVAEVVENKEGIDAVAVEKDQ